MAFTREDRRRLAMGLSTVLGIARRGFFIPYRHADAIPRPDDRPHLAVLETLFRARETAFRDMIATIDRFAEDLEAIGTEPPPAPRWNQQWFPRLDAASAYALVRRMQPKRVVEVGAGHSTRFIARAVADGGLETRVTTIDPAPRAGLDGLGVELVRATLQEAGMAPFEGLEPGDIVSVDSSHILMPGTDVDLLMNAALPAIPSGVVVHFHDQFLPDDYPPEWAWRGYNEQLGVALLLHGEAYRILWSSRYAATRMRASLAPTVCGRLPILAGAFESSLWLEKG